MGAEERRRGGGPRGSLAEARGPPPASPPTPSSAASASPARPAAAAAAPAAEQEPDGQRSPAASAAAESPGHQVGRELGGSRGWGWGRERAQGQQPGAMKHSGRRDCGAGGFVWRDSRHSEAAWGLGSRLGGDRILEAGGAWAGGGAEG